LLRRPSQSKDYDPDQYLRDADNRFSFDPEVGIYTPKTYYEHRESTKKKKQFSRYEKWSLIVGACAFLIVALYTHYARLQWREMKRTADESIEQTKQSAKTLRISQRAWLVPVGVEMENFENNKDFRMWQELPNNGPTPAKNVTAVVTICKWTDDGKGHPQGRRCEQLPTGKKGTLVKSGGGFKVPFHWFQVSNSMVIDQKTIDDIVRGTISVRVYGTVSYDDIFDHHHWVKFCSEYAWDERRFMSCTDRTEMDSDPE
jgi:hypothetical protein